MSNFKIGDRVIYNKGLDDQDTGTIISKSSEESDYYTQEEKSWYIRWDSNGDSLHANERQFELIPTEVDSECSKLRSKEKKLIALVMGVVSTFELKKEYYAANILLKRMVEITSE